MLASVVMPAAGKFTSFIPVSQVPLGSARMLLVAAILVEAITLSSLFVEYLRRSGFHAAARGDGAVANLIFATHEKWTLFGHLSSGRRPLFDGENKMRLAFVPAYVTNAI